MNKHLAELVFALALLINLIVSLLEQFDIFRPEGTSIGEAKIIFAIYLVGIAIYTRLPRMKE